MTIDERLVALAARWPQFAADFDASRQRYAALIALPGSESVRAVLDPLVASLLSLGEEIDPRRPLRTRAAGWNLRQALRGLEALASLVRRLSN